MSDDDLTASRQQGYDGFIRFATISSVVVAVVLAIVIVGFVA
jgi:hypothetical protein